MITKSKPEPASHPTGHDGRKSPLDKFLGIFTETKAGEAGSALLLALGVFFLLTCYYLLKTAREPLILQGGGAEVKSYSTAGQALLLVPVTWIYGKIAARVGRIKLVTIVALFFVANIVAFGLALGAGLAIGVPFFVWVGIFNVLIVAQFWSFAADVYAEEQGKRLFVILGIGSTVGAVAGSAIARSIIKPIGVGGMLFLAAGFLVASLAIIRVVHARETKRAEGAAEPKVEKPLSKKGGLALLVRDRYLLLIAAFIFLLNCINTNGEYILDRALLQHVKESMPAGVDPEAYGTETIGKFKASYFLFVNVATVVLQLFGVSRIIKYLGVRKALFIAPVVSLLGYSTMFLVPIIGVIFVAKIAENTLDYSLQNTVKQTLWLPTDRDAKYKAKNVIDSLILRIGDLLSAGVTAAGAALHFGTRSFILVNTVFVVGFLLVVGLLARQHAKVDGKKGDDDKSEPEPARPAPAPAGTQPRLAT